MVTELAGVGKALRVGGRRGGGVDDGVGVGVRGVSGVVIVAGFVEVAGFGKEVAAVIETPAVPHPMRVPSASPATAQEDQRSKARESGGKASLSFREELERMDGKIKAKKGTMEQGKRQSFMGPRC
jgi:hypothetical protein